MRHAAVTVVPPELQHESERLENEVLCFLHHYASAADAGYASAKVGWAQTGEPMYKNQMAYWQHVRKAIKWLIAHTKHWHWAAVEIRSHEQPAAPTQSGD